MTGILHFLHGRKKLLRRKGKENEISISEKKG
jgi:hypothetical protein